MMILMYLSHFFVDYYRQSNDDAKTKKSCKNDGFYQVLGKHFLQHLIWPLIAMLILYLASSTIIEITNNNVNFDFDGSFKVFFGLVLIIIIIVMIHALIDFGKSCLKDKFIFYVLDQLLHISSIYAVVYAVTLYNPNLSNIFLVEFEFVMLVLIGLILSTNMSSMTIDKFFTSLSIDKSKEPNEENAKTSIEEDVDKHNPSETIGKVERVLIVLSLVSGYEIVVAAVLGFKTLVNFSDKRKLSAEYFILGNMLSILMALFTYGYVMFLYHDLM